MEFPEEQYRETWDACATQGAQKSNDPAREQRRILKKLYITGCIYRCIYT